MNAGRSSLLLASGRKRPTSITFCVLESSDIVRPIHAKAMPVLLTMAEQWETRLTGSVEEAIALQKPLANEMLHIVATGEKSDHIAMPCPAFTSDKQPMIGDVIAPVSSLQDRLPH
jgi:putative SOS response-associated peptidase YedK